MTRRLFVTGGILLGLAVVLAVVGYIAGVPIAMWKLRAFGQTEVFMASPKEPFGVGIATAAMFAWPAISTIIAVALHRWRKRVDASPGAVAVYFVIPAAILAGYILLRVYQLSQLSFDDGVAPRFSLASLGPGSDEARLVGFVSICLWIFIGTRKPPKL